MHIHVCWVLAEVNFPHGINKVDHFSFFALLLITKRKLELRIMSLLTLMSTQYLPLICSALCFLLRFYLLLGHRHRTVRLEPA